MIEFVVLVNDPIPKTRAGGQFPCECRIDHTNRGQPGKRAEIVGRRGLPRPRQQVIVDVDHATNHPFEMPFGDGLIHTRCQVRILATIPDRGELIKIPRN